MGSVWQLILIFQGSRRACRRSGGETRVRVAGSDGRRQSGRRRTDTARGVCVNSAAVHQCSVSAPDPEWLGGSRLWDLMVLLPARQLASTTSTGKSVGRRAQRIAASYQRSLLAVASSSSPYHQHVCVFTFTDHYLFAAELRCTVTILTYSGIECLHFWPRFPDLGGIPAVPSATVDPVLVGRHSHCLFWL